MIDRHSAASAAQMDQLGDLLRQCVQCGLCLPHCATWLATGNEVQSPRGRLLLLGEMINTAQSVPAAAPKVFLQAFAQCIGCRACEAACPSGVPFTLLEYGQSLAVDVSRLEPNRSGSAVPGSVLRRMDQPGFLAFLGRLAEVARGLLSLTAGRLWRRRLDRAPVGGGRLVRLLGSLPTSPRSDAELVRMLDELCGHAEQQGRGPGHGAPAGTAADNYAGPRIAFFQGCANAGLLPGSSRRLRELLAAAGCRLEEPGAQDCCGALARHTGRTGRSVDLRRRNREAFAEALDAGTAIVAEAAGCGLELKSYGEDFRAKVTDAVVLLAGLDLPPVGTVPLKVVYHDPCHALHGQGIAAEPRKLLASIPGLEIVEPMEQEVCCGSGGAWGLDYPELSATLALRKAENLAATGARLVVTSNPGCLGQIADGLRMVAPELPILPLTDLLWYAVMLRAAEPRS